VRVLGVVTQRVAAVSVERGRRLGPRALVERECDADVRPTRIWGHVAAIAEVDKDLPKAKGGAFVDAENSEGGSVLHRPTHSAASLLPQPSKHL
jgi:hypothetical protein